MRRSAVCKLFDIDMKDQKQLYDYLTEESTLQDVLIEYGQDERKFSCILQKKQSLSRKNCLIRSDLNIC